MSELISIVIPIYNAESYIERCLNSILEQTYENFEVLLINDGSTDEGLKRLKEYQKKDKRFKLFNQINSGPSAARNKGIVNSKGKYLIFIDIDDYIQKEYIESLYKEIIKGYDLTASGYTDISKYGKIKLNDFYKDNSKITKEEFINRIFDGIGGTLWGKIFRRELIEKYNLQLNKNIFMCEDEIFVLEYSLRAQKFSAINKNEYNYNRLNENSISKKIDFRYYKNFNFFIEQLEKILDSSIEKSLKDSILEKRIENILNDLIVAEYKTNGIFNIKEKIKKFKLLNTFVGRVRNPRLSLTKELKNERYFKIYLKFLFIVIFQKFKYFIKFKVIKRC